MKKAFRIILGFIFVGIFAGSMFLLYNFIDAEAPESFSIIHTSSIPEGAKIDPGFHPSGSIWDGFCMSPEEVLKLAYSHPEKLIISFKISSSVNKVNYWYRPTTSFFYSQRMLTSEEKPEYNNSFFPISKAEIRGNDIVFYPEKKLSTGLYAVLGICVIIGFIGVILISGKPEKLLIF